MVYCRTLPDLTFPVTEWDLGTRLVYFRSCLGLRSRFWEVADGEQCWQVLLTVGSRTTALTKRLEIEPRFIAVPSKWFPEKFRKFVNISLPTPALQFLRLCIFNEIPSVLENVRNLEQLQLRNFKWKRLSPFIGSLRNDDGEQQRHKTMISLAKRGKIRPVGKYLPDSGLDWNGLDWTALDTGLVLLVSTSVWFAYVFRLHHK